MTREPVIRPATIDDAAALLDIYAPYVRDTAITFDYDVPSLDEFAGRIESTMRRYPYLVAELGGRPVGYAYAGVFKDRAAYDWAVETSIYVARGERGHGVGSALYDALEQALVEQGVLNLCACIAHATTDDDPHLTNASEAFHAKHGFSYVGRFHACGFKFGTWYDMVWMEKLVGEHTASPRPVSLP